ncbi:PAS domain-containing protein [Paludibacterium denitrificans]|nr:PAS domain S-box protein [Paludibacterium denitrificans]
MVGDDIILARVDITEIRHGEQALRDSEQRFRNMVEQTVSGMYVRRDGRFIYVNPRYCEITGWSADELLGRNVLDFTDTDPESSEQIQQAWARLGAQRAHCFLQRPSTASRWQMD